MKEKPDWLPVIVSIDGVWELVLSRLYTIFDRDFKQLKPMFSAMQVWWDRRVLGGERYEEGFWHLISRYEKETEERLLVPDGLNVCHGAAQPSLMLGTMLSRSGIIKRGVAVCAHMSGWKTGTM